MSKINKAMKYLTDPDYRFLIKALHGFYNHLADEVYIQRMFKAKMGYELDLKHPRTFNEKLQWLKLFDREPIYQTMVDKYAVKQYVASIIGSEYIIPTIGVWDHFEDIDFSVLPDQFVLKCTHDSGGLAIVKDKNKMNIEAIRKRINKSLKSNYFYYGREWPYLGIQPRIICEQYKEDEDGKGLKDYKVLCFNGVPKLIEFHKGRYTKDYTQDYYDDNWNLTSIAQSGDTHYKKSGIAVQPPSTLQKMIEMSKLLSAHTYHLRVDWYSIGEKLFFGELTFYDGSGFEPFDNKDDDLLLGSWIKLPDVTRKTNA